MKRNGSTIGATQDELQYEKTLLLAALEHDSVAGDLSEWDRRHHRRRVVLIQHQLSTWTR